MPELRFVINDPKTGKSYPLVKDVDLIGTKIKDKIDGSLIEMEGYEFEIAGGSDNAGFPMRYDLPISGRKKILITRSTGLKTNIKGMKKKKTFAGNIIGNATVQVNLKILKYGPKPLSPAGTNESEEK